MNSPLLSKDNITELEDDNQKFLNMTIATRGWIFQGHNIVDKTKGLLGLETRSIGESTNVQNNHNRRQLNYGNQVSITVILHLVLISVYIVLFGVYSGHYEHRVVIPLDESWIQTAVTAVSQLIGTVREPIQ